MFQQAHQSTQMKEESVHMNIGKLELPKLKHEGKKKSAKNRAEHTRAVEQYWMVCIHIIRILEGGDKEIGAKEFLKR